MNGLRRDGWRLREALGAVSMAKSSYEYASRLDAYLRWYRDERLKSDLGYRSPMQYRWDLGLLAER